MNQVTSDRRNRRFNVNCQLSIVHQGFTLIDLLVTIGLLGVLTVGIFGGWVLALQVMTEKRAEVVATSIATEMLEQTKSLPYENVGTIGGIPQGTIPQIQNSTRNGTAYTVKTSILAIDDPFDGTAPADLLPADYKRIRVEVIWSGKFGVSPVVLVTDIAPKGIETNAGGGTILLRVVDAKREPISGATVRIQHTAAVPPIDLSLTTNAEGQLMIPGSPAATEKYDITVTKDGYSEDKTTRATVGTNPSPTQPPLSVFEGKLTEATFAIDRFATLTVKAVDNRGSQGWWRSTWPYRMNITVTNKGTADTPSGNAVTIDFDHATLVKIGRSLASGDDVRVVFWNGTYFEELDRIATTPWGETKTRLWFATKKTIKKNESDENYALYYGNLAAGTPLSSASRIFPPPLGSDTVGLWYLDDGKGSTVARDASGNGHDGELRYLDPQSAWVDGRFGNALAFKKTDGVYPHVYVAPTATLKNIQTFTIEAWIKPTDLSGSHIIVSKATNNKQEGKFHFYTSYKSICLFVWKDVNPYDGGACSGTLTANVWQHVAATFDGRYIRTYINGALVGTAEKPGNLIQQENIELNIGRYASKNWDFFAGTIDNVALHRSVRTDFSYGRTTNLTTSMIPEQWYQEPNAIAGIPVTITGAKIIGVDDAGRPIPKFTVTRTTNPIGQIVLSNLEWDTYTMTVDKATGYDIAATLPPIPVRVSPQSAIQERLTLLPHRDHTLLVTVKDSQENSLDGASVRLTNDDLRYDKTVVSGESGQTFFSPLTGDTAYTLTVGKPGYTTTTANIHVQEQTYEDVAIASQ